MGNDKLYRLLIVFYAICLITAGLGHALDIWRGGWMPYIQAPPAMNLYWTLLAIFDMLAAGLLFLRLRVGLMFVLIIMTSDVLINSYGTYRLHVLEGGWSLQLQSLFLGLVIGAMPNLWSTGNKKCTLMKRQPTNR